MIVEDGGGGIKGVNLSLNALKPHPHLLTESSHRTGEIGDCLSISFDRFSVSFCGSSQDFESSIDRFNCFGIGGCRYFDRFNSI